MKLKPLDLPNPFRWDPKAGAIRMAVGQAVTCTNRDTSEFTYGVNYPIERVLGRCNADGCVAVVRNNRGELRVLTSLAWSMGHWIVAPNVGNLQVVEFKTQAPDWLKHKGV